MWVRPSPNLIGMTTTNPTPPSVRLLWHVHHIAEDADGNVVHFTGEDAWANEEEGDDVKFLGAYSSSEVVEQRIARFSLMPGFRDEPGCFWYAEYPVDEDQWTDGFGSEEPALD